MQIRSMTRIGCVPQAFKPVSVWTLRYGFGRYGRFRTEAVKMVQSVLFCPAALSCNSYFIVAVCSDQTFSRLVTFSSASPTSRQARAQPPDKHLDHSTLTRSINLRLTWCTKVTALVDGYPSRQGMQHAWHDAMNEISKTPSSCTVFPNIPDDETLHVGT